MSPQTDDTLEHDDAFSVDALASRPVSASSGGFEHGFEHDDAFTEPSSPSITPEPSWNRSDIPLGLTAGYHAGVAAPLAGLTSRLAESPEAQRYYYDIAGGERKAAEENEAQMTPGATKTWPVWGAEQVAPMVALAGPALAAGPFGEIAATGAGVLASGAVATGQRISDVAGAIDKAPVEALMKDPQFAFEVNNGVPVETAKFNLNQRNQSAGRDIATFGLGAVAGGLGPAGLIAGGVDPLKFLNPSESRLIATALGFGEGATFLGGQMFGQGYMTQQTAHEAGAGEAPTLQSVTQGTGAGLLVGGVFGGLGAAMHAHPGIDKGPPRPPSQTAPARAAEPGKATAVGSPRDYGKAKELPESKERVAPVVDAFANQAAAPPPPSGQEGGQGPELGVSEDPAVVAAATAAARPPEGEPTTPESTKPQPTPVDTTQVAQNAPPRVEPAQDQQGRPLGGVEGPPVSIPMDQARGQPAAFPGAPAERPGAPAPGAERTVPEPDAALLAQQKEIKSGDRNFVYYPPGTAPPPHIAGVNRAVVQGDTVVRIPYGKKGDLTDAQVFDFSPKVKEPLDKIKFALDNDRLNELLKLGPVSKAEAEARVNQLGETPTVVTVRDEAGNELKAAAGTTETAPVQAQALEESKASPEHVVQVESHENALADRFAKVRAENVAREQAQAPKAPIIPTGRTLESTRPEDQAAAAHSIAIEAERVRTIEEQLKARRAEREAEEAAAKEKQKTGKNWTKEEIRDINNTNKLADNITSAHRVRFYNDPKAVFDSAKAMADAAKNANLKVPKLFGEGHPYNPNVLRLREAIDLANSAKLGREATDEALGRFIHRDSLINEGRIDEAYGDRRAEGAAMLGAPEGIGEARPGEHEAAEVSPEEHVVRAEEEGKGEREVGAGGEEGVKAEPRERPKLELAEGEGYTAVKPVTTGFQAVKKGERVKLEVGEKPKVSVGERLKAQRTEKEAQAKPEDKGILKQRIPEEGERKEGKVEDTLARIKAEIAARKAELEAAEGPAVRGPKTITTSNDDHMDVEIPAQEETNVRHILSNIDYSKFVLPDLTRGLVKLMVRTVGDMPVYMVKHEDLKSLGTSMYGGYVYDHDHILLNADRVHPGGRQVTNVHEVLHAITAHLYKNDPKFKAIIDQLRDEAKPQFMASLPDDPAYGISKSLENAISSGQEFIAELLSNPEVQEAFKKIKISSDLAQKIGIPRWRKATMWSGFLTALQKALGMDPRSVSVLEAATSIAERGAYERPEGRDIALEYAGRLSEADAGRLGPLDRIAKFNVKAETDAAILKQMGPITLQRAMDNAESTLEGGKNGGDRVEGRLDSLAPSFARTIAGDLKTNVKYYARKGLLNGLAPTQTAGLFRRMFMDKESTKTGNSVLDDLNHAVEGRHQEFAKLNEADRTFLAKSYMLAKKYSEHMNDFGRLLDMSGKYGIHADEDPPKERAKLENGAMDDWQAVKFGPEARGLLSSMPEELREHYTELKAFYKEKAQALAKEHIQNVLDIFDPIDKNNLKSAIERNERVNRVLAHNMTDEDKAYYRNLPGNTNVVEEINKLYGFLNPKGVYFNAYRDGDFLATGLYDMPEGGSGTAHSGELLPDNVREFDTRKEAHAYATGTEMHATPEIVRYVKDPDNPGQFLDHLYNPETGKFESISPQDADVTKYRVTLQREHTEMGRTPAQAERAREEMIKLGVKNVSQVLDKRKEENWTQLNNANARAFENKIKDRNDLSRTEQRKLIDASRQLGLMSQSGNRMNKYWTTRRNIAGANYNEIYEAAHNYANASNFHMANARATPEIDRAMQRLDTHEESNRESNDAYMISTIANHMRDRVYAGPDSLSPKTPTWLRALKVLAFSKYLLTPRFIFQHQIHPLAFTAPQMAGRHGYMNAVGYLWHALNDVGGNVPNIGEGLKASGRMAKALFTGTMDERIAAGKPLDMVDRIIAKINANSTREGDALKALRKSGAFHSGFDDEFYGASGLDKVDMMMRQTTNAMEATNRTVAGLGAYRAEYDKLVNMGKSSQTAHEGAIRYAQQVIQNSMGVFSPTNMANMFKHPYLRAALQFKQFPLQQTYAFLRNIHDAFQGESQEVRREATRAATAQMMSAAVMTGVHGLPLLGVLKAGGLLGMALGVTPSPSQIDDRMYRLLADKLSPGMAKAIMSGPLSALSPYMPDVSNVFGYSGDFFYGEPHNNDWKSYAWDLLGGAPLSAAGDTWNGMADVWHGDFAKGAAKASPIGAISNLARAFTLGTEGAQTPKGLQITPASPEAAMLKIFGFTTSQQSRAYGARQALEEDIQESKDAKSQALDQARKGNMAAVLKWNNANPHDKISPAQAQQARKGQSAQSILGIKITPKNQAQLREYQVYQ